jgi:phage terminase large subunit-like protein
VVTVRGSTWENKDHLSPDALAELKRRYEGTRLGRQELEGELIEDIEGALWTRALIEPNRVTAIDRSRLVRIVVAVDPAATAEGDETGIVVAGVDRQRQGYVLEDLTCQLPPDQWARRAVSALKKWKGHRLVAEANNGGQLVATVLNTISPSLPLKLVHASRGKITREEPIAALYEQGKVHHVGVLDLLEDELCSWVPGMASPDRLDALVWALTELSPGSLATVGAPIFVTSPSRWAPLSRRAWG